MTEATQVTVVNSKNNQTAGDATTATTTTAFVAATTDVGGGVDAVGKGSLSPLHTSGIVAGKSLSAPSSPQGNGTTSPKSRKLGGLG